MTFFQKKCQKCSFFQKIAIGNFFEKNENFWQFKKKSQDFGNFLTVKWQFYGGSGHIYELNVFIILYKLFIILCKYI